MDEKKKAEELKVKFHQEFDKTLEQLVDTYPRHSRVKTSKTLTEDVFRIVINMILLNTLREVQIDTSKLTIKEFHRKYTPNLPILYRYDFSSEDFTKIIEHSYLEDRDKKIALEYFIKKKSHDGVYNEVTEVGNKKTIGNNIKPINDILLDRACDFNNEHTKLKEN